MKSTWRHVTGYYHTVTPRGIYSPVDLKVFIMYTAALYPETLTENRKPTLMLQCDDANMWRRHGAAVMWWHQEHRSTRHGHVTPSPRTTSNFKVLFDQLFFFPLHEESQRSDDSTGVIGMMKRPLIRILHRCINDDPPASEELQKNK